MFFNLSVYFISTVALLFLSLPAAVLISPIEVLGQFYHFDENNF